MNNQIFVSALIYFSPSPGNNTFFKKLEAYLTQNFENFEILVVVDGGNTVSKSNLNITNLKLIQLSSIVGKEKCFQTLYDAMIGDIAIEFEFINEHLDLNTLNEMISKCQLGNDIVLLSNKKSNKSLILNMFIWLIKRFSSFSIKNRDSIVKVLSKKAIYAISNINDSIRYRKILYQIAGLKINNIYSDSILISDEKTSALKSFFFYLNVLIRYTNITVYLSVIMSFLFLFLSTISGFYAVYTHYYENTAFGWPSLVCIISFFFSGVFFILGLISLNLNHLRENNSNYPLYNIRKVE